MMRSLVILEIKKKAENVFIFNWTISIRNCFSRPMKFEDKIVQWTIFKMRPIPIFYDKPYFRFVKKNTFTGGIILVTFSFLNPS